VAIHAKGRIMGIRFPNESNEYRAARDRLLKKEIELRRAMEAVADERRALPPGPLVRQDYVFDGLGPDGRPAKVRLSELFAPGTDTLFVYNYMFPRMSADPRPKPTTGKTARLEKEETPCPSCTAFIDGIDGTAPHLEAAGFNLVIVAKTTLDRLTDFARERGWKNLRLLSAADNGFKEDYHSQKDGESEPMMSVFVKGADGIRHFWSSEMNFEKPDPGQDSCHNGTVEMLWNFMDLTPRGRPANWREGVDDHGPAEAKPETIAAWG
jgi:predicted dithiol-disulfide oxidoreductase (DUF899 family)